MRKRVWILRAFVLLFFVFAPLLSSKAQASGLGLLRRWVVFPFDVDSSLKKSADDAWLNCRQKLTDSKKYLVAGKEFMIRSEVFQPRRELSSKDIEVLADLLKADVLVTGYSEKRQFILNAYLAQTKQLIWSKHLAFHPSLNAGDQLEFTSRNLMGELIAEVPYQAFTIVDPLIGKPVYEETGKSYVVVDVGNTDGLTTGMDIQWIEVSLPEELKEGNGFSKTKTTLIGEGRISKVKRGVVVAELLLAKSKEAILEASLVKIPKEAQRMAQIYTPSADIEEKGRLAPELIPSAISPVAPESKEKHQKGLFIGSILGILGIIALAL